MGGRQQMRWRIAGVVAMLLLAVGCSSLPTQPMLPRGAGSTLGAGGANGSLTGLLGTDGHGEDDLLPQLPVLYPIGTVLDSLGVGELVPIKGKDGGELDLWGVTLRIPANAISGDATLTMTMLDASKQECQFELNPAYLNHFNSPVTLQFDVSSAPDLRVLSVYWWDPANNDWVAIPSTIDSNAKTISAQLQHFSKYKVDSELLGKAGW